MNIREKIRLEAKKVTLVVNEMRKQAEMFGEYEEALMRRCNRLAMVGSRKGRGRLKKNWGEPIKQDIMHFQLNLKIVN